MPLTLLSKGERRQICRVGGSAETRRFLESLGFVSGADVEIVNEIGGNMIVNIMSSRVAINKDMAKHIQI
ncbi:MAG: FeoA family protein [Candidatus Ornithospirochaeta sp.]|nr:FeoA family protein [Candidatus Ornithospirochaeta sp.]